MKQYLFLISTGDIAEALKLERHLTGSRVWKAALALGKAQMLQGRPRDAVNTFSYGLKLDPYNYELYSKRGIILNQIGRKDEALRDFYLAYEFNYKQDPAPANNLGFFLLEQGRCDLAVPYFEEALAIYPNYSIAQTNLGKCS